MSDLPVTDLDLLSALNEGNAFETSGYAVVSLEFLCTSKARLGSRSSGMEITFSLDSGCIEEVLEHQFRCVIQHEGIELLNAAPRQGMTEGISNSHQAIKAVAM